MNGFAPISRKLIAALSICASAQIGCSDSAPSAPPPEQPLGDPLTWDASLPGLYTCGHRTLTVTYTPPTLPARTIPIDVWYPSTSTDGVHPKYHAVFEDALAYDDVPLAPTSWKDGMPVLVHSHGHRGFSGNSARIMCHFASHGWLAVAPDHVGNTIGDTPDKRPLDTYIHRPFDIRATLDFIAELPSNDPLSGKMDFGRVAMSGHSFGSYTSWALAGAPLQPTFFEDRCTSGEFTDCSPEKLQVLAGDLSEPRIRIAMPLAGAPRGEIDDADFDAARVPVLMMSGSLDQVGDDIILANVSKVDLTWVEIEGGCHQLFGLGNSVLGDPPCAALPDEEGFSLVNPWVLGYARYHVLDDRSDFVKGIIEGTLSPSPKAHYQHVGP